MFPTVEPMPLCTFVYIRVSVTLGDMKEAAGLSQC